MTRLGVIGTGGIAGVHMDNLKTISGVEIAALCDINPEQLTSKLESYGGRGYNDFREMIAQEALDGVLLCTPPAVRYEPIKACIEKGIPIFVEKPPSVTLEEGEKIRDLLQAHQHPHFVGFVFRWTRFLQPVFEVLKGRQIYGIQSHYFADMMFPEARARCSHIYYDKALSGGMIGDQALHIIDLIRWLSQADARRVTGFGNNFLCPKGPGITTEETVAFQLQMDNGVVANHLHTWAFPRWEIVMNLFGQGFNFRLNLGESKVTGQVDGKEFEAAQESQMHCPLMEDFVEFIRTRNPELVKSDYSDAIKTQALTQAINQSVEQEKMIDL
ncbi:MAG: L-arabinose 1-dehydrogenase [Candidatus Hinthialibacteria bacterium OLB16]|nr:MAG: L-arabinose 1-dehydrogenase [Candidatus Hinthialibacteria bacterium OLB16]